jgi:GT2 family glycosyltransferase
MDVSIIIVNYNTVQLLIDADLMIRKEIFESLNGFDTDFFMYHEESELEYRVKKAGYKIINVPCARIIHLEGKSFSDSGERFRKIYAPRIIFLQKTHNPMLIKIINILAIFIIKQRLFVFSILRNKGKIVFWSKKYKLLITPPPLIIRRNKHRYSNYFVINCRCLQMETGKAA